MGEFRSIKKSLLLFPYLLLSLIILSSKKGAGASFPVSFKKSTLSSKGKNSFSWLGFYSVGGLSINWLESSNIFSNSLTIY